MTTLPRIIRIGGRPVGPGAPVFVIAEAGVNHGCDLATAKRMVRAAARAGVSAIKFQTYKAETLASRYSPKYWKHVPGSPRTQFGFFKQLDHFNAPDYAALAAECRRAGILFMSTPWDLASADLLDRLGVPAFKIGSADITYHQLIRHCARKGKPMILATGASTLEEIRAAVRVVESCGNRQIVLMHCVLAYHTLTHDAHLAWIRTLQQAFPWYPVGFSDHTIADSHMTVQVAAVAAGAHALEKHYTLDKRAPGNDHWHSMEPQEFRQLVAQCGAVRAAMGRDNTRMPLPCERLSRRFARRSVVATREIPRGARIQAAWLTCKRPGTGVPPVQLAAIVGQRARRTIREDMVITPSMVEPVVARAPQRRQLVEVG